jgi:hypothetical protein
MPNDQSEPGEMGGLAGASSPKTPERVASKRPLWRRKALLATLALSLTCCCGSPLAWLAFTASGSRKVTRFHETLRPGMSMAEVLEQADDISLGLGLSRVFLFPRGTAVSAITPEDGCPTRQSLVWSPNSAGPSWSPDQTGSTLAEAASKLTRCDEVEFQFVVLFSRFEFTVKLEEGKVREIGSLEGSTE